MSQIFKFVLLNIHYIFRCLAKIILLIVTEKKIRSISLCFPFIVVVIVVILFG